MFTETFSFLFCTFNSFFTLFSFYYSLVLYLLYHLLVSASVANKVHHFMTHDPRDP